MHIKHSIIVVMLLGLMSVAMGQLIWSAQTSGITQDLRGITYGNNQFVAVGWGGTILTSPDGITWTSRTSGTVNAVLSIAWSNNQFIAGDISGTIHTSPDGVTWTARASGTAGPLSGIAWGNNQFIIVGSFYETLIASSDGIIWSTRPSSTSQLLYGVAWGSNQFVAVGSGGTIISSPEGNSWTSRTSGTTQRLQNIAFGDNQFVAVGDSGKILTSPDGIIWTTRISGTSQFLLGITWGSNQFVAVGYNGTILTSPDGVTWTTSFSGTVQNLYGAVSVGSNQFIVDGYNGTILTSSTSPLAVTALALPANNAINIARTPTLTWSTVAGAVTYRVQLSTVSTFTTNVVDDSTLTTGVKPITQQLPASTVYYWHVNAKNAGGTGLYSGTYSFTTTPPAPAAPVLWTPANNASLVGTTPTLTWGSVPNAVTYRVQVATSSTFNTTVIDDSTLTAGLKVIYQPLTEDVDWWRVNAKNAGGTSLWSTASKFTVGILGIKYVPAQNLPATLSHSGVLEVYRTNGTIVRKIAYEATATKAQLLNSASKTLAHGYYTYNFRRSADGRVMGMGRLVK